MRCGGPSWMWKYCGCEGLYYYCYYYIDIHKRTECTSLMVAAAAATAVTINEIGKNDTSSQHCIHTFFRSSFSCSVFTISPSLFASVPFMHHRCKCVCAGAQCVHWNGFSRRSFFIHFFLLLRLSLLKYRLPASALPFTCAINVTCKSYLYSYVWCDHTARAQRPSSHSRPIFAMNKIGNYFMRGNREREKEGKNAQALFQYISHSLCRLWVNT